ncbi:MAG: MmgE/PrpD family protein [Pseudomonadota bacterium]
MGQKLYEFLYDTQLTDIPKPVQERAKLWLIDLIGVAAAGHATELSCIISNHATEHFAAGQSVAKLLFDGRAVSPAGMALAGGMTIDSIDGHDGYRPAKGHVGCALLPGLLAFAQMAKMTGDEFLTLLVIGYEIGARAGAALHASTADYHTSGAWMAPCIAALGARALHLTHEQTRHAIGIAEYHGPRSQMMRVIDHPTMLKDGSGWGAMAGVSAVFLAADGFTGAPAVSFEEEPSFYDDLGGNWLTLQQYYKPFPVCRWAQPAITATLRLREDHNLASEDVDHIEVTTFHEALRLAITSPRDTEQAQYSTSYPTAAAMVRGDVGVAEISADAFNDPEIKRLSESMVISESNDCNEIFPKDRISAVTLHMKSGAKLTSGYTRAIGDPEDPARAEEMTKKFFKLARPVIGQERAEQVMDAVETLENDLPKLISLLTRSVPRHNVVSDRN